MPFFDLKSASDLSLGTSYEQKVLIALKQKFVKFFWCRNPPQSILNISLLNATPFKMVWETCFVRFIIMDSKLWESNLTTLRNCLSIITLEIVNNFWTYVCFNDLFDTLSAQWNILRCFIILPFCPNGFRHSGHWNSLFLSWTVFTCLFKSNRWQNDFAQLTHWNSFLPSCKFLSCLGIRVF